MSIFDMQKKQTTLGGKILQGMAIAIFVVIYTVVTIPLTFINMFTRRK